MLRRLLAVSVLPLSHLLSLGPCGEIQKLCISTLLDAQMNGGGGISMVLWKNPYTVDSE